MAAAARPGSTIRRTASSAHAGGAGWPFSLPGVYTLTLGALGVRSGQRRRRPSEASNNAEVAWASGRLHSAVVPVVAAMPVSRPPTSESTAGGVPLRAASSRLSVPGLERARPRVRSRSCRSRARERFRRSRTSLLRDLRSATASSRQHVGRQEAQPRGHDTIPRNHPRRERGQRHRQAADCPRPTHRRGIEGASPARLVHRLLGLTASRLSTSRRTIPFIKIAATSLQRCSLNPLRVRFRPDGYAHVRAARDAARAMRVLADRASAPSVSSCTAR